MAQRRTKQTPKSTPHTTRSRKKPGAGKRPVSFIAQKPLVSLNKKAQGAGFQKPPQKLHHQVIQTLFEISILTTAALSVVLIFIFIILNRGTTMQAFHDINCYSEQIALHLGVLESKNGTGKTENTTTDTTKDMTDTQKTDNVTADGVQEDKEAQTSAGDTSEATGAATPVTTVAASPCDTAPQTGSSATSDGSTPVRLDLGIKPSEGVYGITPGIRLANYYGYDFNYGDEDTLRSFAKYDMIVGINSWEYSDIPVLQDRVGQLRGYNPHIKILDYIFMGVEADDAGWTESDYLHKSNGDRVTWWPGSYVLNFTKSSVVTKFINYLADRQSHTGVFDGVYFDGVLDTISWLGPIDIDNNGTPESSEVVDRTWEQSMKDILVKTREYYGNDFIIHVNGSYRDFNPQIINGMTFEDVFNQLNAAHPDVASQYDSLLSTYLKFVKDTSYPRSTTILQGSTVSSGYEPWNLSEGQQNALLEDGFDNYRIMRLGLGTALLGQGYYAYDLNDRWRGQLWFYDEYDVDLGKSLGDPVKIKTGLWRRDFENGIVVVNGTGTAQTVTLNGTFHEINGTQDRTANGGRTVTAPSIPALDARIYLR